MKSGGLLPVAVILVLGILQLSWAQRGSCPLDHNHCILPVPNQCKADQDCSRGYKCCYFHCGLKCVIPRRNVIKKGRCPVVNIRCAMLNPPNRCLKDSDCPARKICCEGACGKACVTPERN
ncbi:antileukoproteinase-like [Ornithorhynchus anatinus]|uniref:antileukoproteinase-like n=1 Tax=Ornithorhynchus anatinus TaxID=9258 RepID=UPI00028F3B1F|nr:antileukoproteinase-like [Ornithorhynchus anatinus]